MSISDKRIAKIQHDDEISKGINLFEVDKSYEEVKLTRKSIWDEDCKNKEIVKWPIDARGRYGEHIVRNILEKYKKESDIIEYYEGKQGDWDVKFNDLRIEVKTATLDNQGKFQNENIKKHKLKSNELHPYDVLVLIGISPNNHLFKVFKYDEIDFDNLHNRGEAGTGAAYKMDFYYEKYELLLDPKQLFDEIMEKGYGK